MTMTTVHTALVTEQPIASDMYMKSNSWRLWLTGIFLVALALRLAKLWANTPLVPGGDEPQYLELARGLARSGEYLAPQGIPDVFQGGRTGEQTAFRTPALPALLALHFYLLGPSDLYPRLTLVLLSSLTCVLIALVGRRLISIQSGLLAASCWAVWPPALLSGYAADRFHCENLGIFLLLAHIVTSLLALDRATPVRAVVSGALMGLAVLARGFFLLIIPFSLLFFTLAPVARAKRARLAASFLVGLTLTLGPWMGRNWLLLGRPVISNQTEAFYLGNNPWARGSSNGDLFTLGWKSPQIMLMEHKYPGFREMGELERADAWRAEARHCVLQDPARFAWLLARKTAIFWGPSQDWSWGRYRYHFAFALVMPFFVFGMCTLARRMRLPTILLLLGPVLGVYGACLMTFAHDRYRYTIEPFILLIAAVGLLSLWDPWNRRRISRGSAIDGTQGRALQDYTTGPVELALNRASPSASGPVPWSTD